MKNQIFLLLLFSALTLMLISSCTGDVKVNFFLDGDDFDASETQPSDSSTLKTIFIGDTVVLTDASEPKTSVDDRFWSVDGELLEEKEDQISYTFDEDGMFKIVFCVNGKENCISKWIVVKEDMVIFDDFSPKIVFLSPEPGETNEKRITISVQTENIYSKEELVLLVKDKKVDFEFDEETGVLTAKKIRLSSGENKIEVQARTEEGMDASYIFVERKNKRIKPDPKPPVDTPKPPEKPSPPSKKSVEIVKPFTDFKIDDTSYEVEIKTKGLSGKRDLKIYLNGTEISSDDFSFNKKKEVWIATISNMKKGKNTIEAKAKGKSDKIVINCDIQESLEELGIGGFDRAEAGSQCNQVAGDSYSFSITPNKTVELISFKIYTSLCGELNVKLKSSIGTQRMKTSLVQGVNQISLDFDASLEAGVKYTISCTTSAGGNFCKSIGTPELMDASSCNLSQKSQSQFKMDDHGKSIIYDINYFY